MAYIRIKDAGISAAKNSAATTTKSAATAKSTTARNSTTKSTAVGEASVFKSVYADGFARGVARSFARPRLRPVDSPRLAVYTPLCVATVAAFIKLINLVALPYTLPYYYVLSPASHMLALGVLFSIFLFLYIKLEKMLKTTPGVLLSVLLGVFVIIPVCVGMSFYRLWIVSVTTGVCIDPVSYDGIFTLKLIANVVWLLGCLLFSIYLYKRNSRIFLTKHDDFFEIYNAVPALTASLGITLIL